MYKPGVLHLRVPTSKVWSILNSASALATEERAEKTAPSIHKKKKKMCIRPAQALARLFDLTQPRLHESDACTAEELGMSNRSELRGFDSSLHALAYRTQTCVLILSLSYILSHSLHPSLFLSRFSLSKKRTRTVLKRFYLSPS
jgi:hypothetical protein